MSTKATTWVWEHSRADDTERLVLLAIADAADAEGDNAWPSLDTIARFVRKSERTVRRSIRSLTEIGELEVEIKAGGNREHRADRRPNLYRLPLVKQGKRPDTHDPSKGNPGSQNQVNEGSQLRPVTGDPSSFHDRTSSVSRPDTPGSATTGHCCPIEQNQNTLLEREEAEATIHNLPGATADDVAKVRALIGHQPLEEATS